MHSVTVSGLTKRYGDSAAVDDLDLHVAEGEFLTLLGPSGCGKTTTLRSVAGLESPDLGDIWIGDHLVTSASRRVAVSADKRGIGMVFQNYALWPHMSVFSNVAYPLRMQRLPRSQIKTRVHEMLEMVGLDRFADRPATRLSGGQQQRVALARALVSRPRLLLFDEPLSNLDAKLRASMRAELRAMHARFGTTSIYVTHDQVEATTLSERIVVMNHGRIQQMGTPQEIYWQPKSRFVADFVGFENFLDAEVLHSSSGYVDVKLLDSDTMLRCATREAFPRGVQVELGIRSSAIELSSAPGEDVNVIGAVVADRTYLGDQVQYTVMLGERSLVIRLPISPALSDGSTADLRPGDPVRLRVLTENVVVLPSEPPEVTDTESGDQGPARDAVPTTSTP